MPKGPGQFQPSPERKIDHIQLTDFEISARESEKSSKKFYEALVGARNRYRISHGKPIGDSDLDTSLYTQEQLKTLKEHLEKMLGHSIDFQREAEKIIELLK